MHFTRFSVSLPTKGKNMRKFLIGATNSGCGKTTITAGLLRALSRRGQRVQPFKCGPDYIDTQYHQLACGCESVNLDTWFASPEHLQQVFQHYGADADTCIVEGVMGLFDGYDRWHGSSAEIAKILDIPIILIVNAKSMAYSVAPILWGYKNYRTRLSSLEADCNSENLENVIADKGDQEVFVIFNHVGSDRHARLLRDAYEDTGVTCIGMIPRIKDMAVPSRHLGLTLENTAMMEEMIEKAAQAVEQYVDLSVFEKTAGDSSLFSLHSSHAQDSSLFTLHSSHAQDSSLFTLHSSLKNISIARDEAFNFTYRENIDVLKQKGEATFFSPLSDKHLPEGTDFLYLPGGYPEFFLQQLTENETMRQSIRTYIENGGACLAECGGMMYLCRSIIDSDGTAWPMAGVLQQDATMEGMRLHLGYRTFEHEGRTWCGHEFHYSSVPHPDASLMLPVKMYDARGNEVDTPVFSYKNLMASYAHLYWG